jgi:hypothetical protein
MNDESTVTPGASGSPANPGGPHRLVEPQDTAEAQAAADIPEGAILPADDGEPTGEMEVQDTYQSVEDVAKEVVEGRWGIGQARRVKLSQAGYDVKAVEEEVKRLLKR